MMGKMGDKVRLSGYLGVVVTIARIVSVVGGCTALGRRKMGGSARHLTFSLFPTPTL